MARSTAEVDSASPTGKATLRRRSAEAGSRGGRDQQPPRVDPEDRRTGRAAAVAVWGALPLINAQNWIGLAILVAVTLLAFYVYLSPRAIPAKYLLPGTLFLIIFQIVPVIYTISTAFTNFSDGHRGTKEEAITAIEGASVQQVPDSATYTLTIATDGDATTGDIVFLLSDPATEDLFVGTADGLEELDPGDAERDLDRKDHRGRRLHGPGHRPGRRP